ncbi:alpha/beta fold hydrolase [Burkholderia guangdongensis]|uniref:alpha/beta fold hydrolase n=1 Tax=Burkholderia guangdongensis TaxID=1792500 RepID=UPI0015C98E39|nr:alpha/beta hydrolase [Burkholderia guangdongensis]
MPTTSETSSNSPLPRQRRVQCASPVGLHRIAYTEWGDAANPRVLVCVHGLTRSGRDFDRLAAALSDAYRVVCPDVVGRGQSDWLADPRLYGLPQYVADIVTLIARLDVETVDWFGTSMGGLIGLAFASLPGSPVRKMIVNDVGPRIEPGALARIGEYLGVQPRFSTEQEGIDYVTSLSLSFGALSADEWRQIGAPLVRALPDGGWTLRYDPRIAEPFNAMTPEQAEAGEAMLWRAVDAIDARMLVVRGEVSDLLSRDTAAEMVRRGKRVSLAEIAGVGHAPVFMNAEQIALARGFFVEEAARTS